MITKDSKEIIEERYQVFTSKVMNVWSDRFIYKGKFGKTPKPSIRIQLFATETLAFDQMEKKYTPKGFLENIDILSEKYVKWVSSKDIEVDLEDLRRWFKGVIGEYFYWCVLSDIKTLDIFIDGNGTMQRFDFTHISPIEDNDDFGVDFIGFANDTPAVFQIKTWSNHDERNAPMKIYQFAYAEGCARHYINQDDEYNTFLCWFSREEEGLAVIKQDVGFENRVACIGSRALNEAIKNRYANFWEDFYESFGNFKEK